MTATVAALVALKWWVLFWAGALALAAKLEGMSK
jgi:hypothetical protein